MYRTAPQILFQFMGGLSITQATYPTLYRAFTSDTAAAGSSNAGAPRPTVSAGTFSGVWGSVRWSLSPPPVQRSFGEDMDALVRSHPWITAAVVSAAVVCGGAPALLGSGLSVYCSGGAAGQARYARLKQRISDFSEKGVE